MFTNFILMHFKYYLIYVCGSPAEADARNVSQYVMRM